VLIGCVPLQAVKQLLLMLEVSPGGTAPKGDEAQRILAFFLSSLKNPQLRRPPPVRAMLSFGTLTPHCECFHTWPICDAVLWHAHAATSATSPSWLTSLMLG
jgi:hypothetical protein